MEPTEGIIHYPSGNIAVVACKQAAGFVVTFMSDRCGHKRGAQGGYWTSQREEARWGMSCHLRWAVGQDACTCLVPATRSGDTHLVPNLQIAAKTLKS